MTKKTMAFTPLFNSSGIEEQLNQPNLSFDSSGLFRPLEMIVFPFQELTITEEGKDVVQVVYPAYGKDRFYTLKKFFQSGWNADLKEQQLTAHQILQRLKSYVGVRYLWGGNWVLDPVGLKELDEQFKGYSSEFMKNLKFLFSGLDCSGLLYAATLGKTPRNTSELVHFGEGVSIEGLSLDVIMKKLRVFDLIVWKGHVLVVLNGTELIESRLGFGVVIVSMKDRLVEIMQTRAPSLKATLTTFVVRRWISSL